MPARNMRDYQNLLGRLHGIPTYVDQNIAIMNEAIAEGITQPPIVVELTMKQIAAQAAQDKDKTPLLAAFRRMPSNFSVDEQTKLREEAEASYEYEFQPAWQKLLDYLKTTYTPKARAEVGLGASKRVHRRLGSVCGTPRRKIGNLCRPVQPVWAIGERAFSSCAFGCGQRDSRNWMDA